MEWSLICGLKVPSIEVENRMEPTQSSRKRDNKGQGEIVLWGLNYNLMKAGFLSYISDTEIGFLNLGFYCFEETLLPWQHL